MGIQILAQSAHMQGLKSDGPVGRPLSEPACITSNLPVEIDGAGNNRTGIWEVNVGRFERQLANPEVMHILAGECTFTPDGEAPAEIKAGDTLFFPANTSGVWDVHVPLRKFYVVMG